jgi:membrane protease subunit (stomatin/prohibitin family)
MYAENSFPVWPVVGGVAGAFLFIAIGIVICKMKRNASTKHLQEVVAGGGAGVQTGNANYDRNNQQETFSVQPSAVPVYASEAAPTTKPTAFCANCGTANSKGAFCTVCGVPN